MKTNYLSDVVSRSLASRLQRTLIFAGLLGWLGLALAKPEAVSVSSANPNGQIAYLRLTEGYWQVWLMKPDASDNRQLTENPIDKVHISWGPGNKQLLYNTNNAKTYVINLTDGKQRQILKDVVAKDVAWSPDGTQFAYGLQPESLIQGKVSLWVTDLAGKSKSKIAGGNTHDALSPQWRTDGKGFLFRQCTMVNNMQVAHEFWLGEAGSTKTQVVSGDQEMLKFDQALSVDGQVAYSSAHTGYYELWRIPAEGGDPVQLTRLNVYSGHPSWSETGSHIAFDSDKDGMQQIYQIDREGKDLRRLTTDGVPSRKPVWSQPLIAAVPR